MRPKFLRGNDEGIALVAAVAVVMLVTLLMGSIVAYAMSESRQTGRDRQRSSAIMSAEGGVDTTLAKMQGVALNVLPCGDTVTNGQSAPDTFSVVTTVTYFNAAGTVLACPLAIGALPAQALVKTTSQSNALGGQAAARRTIESQVQLNPQYGLAKAIFGNAGVTFSDGDVYGSEPAKSDADVYSNGNVNCDTGSYRGSVISQGTLTLGGCNVAGNAWAKLGMSGSGASFGGVLVSNGNVVLANSSAVTNTVRASGTIRNPGGTTWAGCATPAKCAAGSTVTPPPAEPFPQLPYNPATVAKWVEAGYNPTVVEKNTCSGGTADDAADWILANGPTLAQPTILHTTCPGGIYFKNNGDILLNNNLVIFADGGVSFKNNATFTSTNTTMRYLYFVQPFGSPVATMPCSVDGIDMKNNLDVAPTVSTLFYTPCNVSNKNNSDFNGQIYAGGTVTSNKHLEVNFRPMPVYGLTNVVLTYNLDILFKRESSAP